MYNHLLSTLSFLCIFLYCATFVSSGQKAELGISSFGVSITTMEEVFIKVGHGEDATLKSK